MYVTVLQTSMVHKFHKSKVQSLLLEETSVAQEPELQRADIQMTMGQQWQSFPRFIACTNAKLWAARRGQSSADLVTIEGVHTTGTAQLLSNTKLMHSY